MMAYYRAGEAVLIGVIMALLIAALTFVGRPSPLRGSDVATPSETPTPHADIGGVVRGPSHAGRGDLYVLASEW